MGREKGDGEEGRLGQNDLSRLAGDPMLTEMMFKHWFSPSLVLAILLSIDNGVLQFSYRQRWHGGFSVEVHTTEPPNINTFMWLWAGHTFVSSFMHHHGSLYSNACDVYGVLGFACSASNFA